MKFGWIQNQVWYKEKASGSNNDRLPFYFILWLYGWVQNKSGTDILSQLLYGAHSNALNHILRHHGLYCRNTLMTCSSLTIAIKAPPYFYYFLGVILLYFHNPLGVMQVYCNNSQSKNQEDIEGGRHYEHNSNWSLIILGDVLKTSGVRWNSNSGHLALKCLVYRLFRAFSFLCDVNMMLPEKCDYFSYPKRGAVEFRWNFYHPMIEWLYGKVPMTGR